MIQRQIAQRLIQIKNEGKVSSQTSNSNYFMTDSKHSRQLISNTLVVLWLFLISPANAQIIISNTDWPEIRTASRVLSMAAVKRAVDEFEAQPNRAITIFFPGGDQGQQWAQELKDWMVVLGIKGEKIQFAAGSGDPNSLSLMVNGEDGKR